MSNPGTLQQSTFASILGGGIVILLVWIVDAFAGVKVPPEVSSSVSLMVMAVLAHFVPDKSGPPTI